MSWIWRLFSKGSVSLAECWHIARALCPYPRAALQIRGRELCEIAAAHRLNHQHGQGPTPLSSSKQSDVHSRCAHLSDDLAFRDHSTFSSAKYTNEASRPICIRMRRVSRKSNDLLALSVCLPSHSSLELQRFKRLTIPCLWRCSGKSRLSDVLDARAIQVTRRHTSHIRYSCAFAVAVFARGRKFAFALAARANPDTALHKFKLY